MKVLVTGGTNGMGKGVALALAAGGAEVIILCRSAERGQSTIREIQAATENPNVSLVQCDLTKLSDVKNVIKEMRAGNTSLDGMFINAGVGYASGRVETVDGLDTHFQVNYLSQFMLTLHLLDLLERSEMGGRVVFNVTEGGGVLWDDLQMRNRWHYRDCIQQAMVAKRLFYTQLHNLSQTADSHRTSFYGFQIPKTVWSNQVNIIPAYMRAMATMVKWFGGFITIEKCGELIAPLFFEDQDASLRRSGKFITATEKGFIAKEDDAAISDRTLQDRLWNISLDLCKDDDTRRIANELVHKAQGTRRGRRAVAAANEGALPHAKAT